MIPTYEHLCKKGDIVGMKKHFIKIKDGIDYGQLLEIACYYKHLEIIKYLTPTFVSPNINHNSPLHISCKVSHIQAVEFLLKSTTNMKIDEIVRSIIDTACKYSNPELIKLLISKSDTIKIDNYETLVTTYFHGKFETLIFLIENYFPVDVYGKDLLNRALRRGYTKVVKYLSKHMDLSENFTEYIEISYKLKKLKTLSYLIKYAEDNKLGINIESYR